MKINRENITKHLVEYQLNMIGKSLIDTLDDLLSENSILKAQLARYVPQNEA